MSKDSDRLFGFFPPMSDKPDSLIAIREGDPLPEVWFLDRVAKKWKRDDDRILDIMPGEAAPDRIYRLTPEAFDAAAKSFGCPTLA